MKESLFKLYKRDDLIIAFAVMIQPLLVVLQFLMISVFNMPEEQTTKYRVLLTAVPMIFAIFVGLKHKIITFLVTYVFLFLFLGLEYLMFPANGTYIFTDSFRFLVPIIVPSILCLSCLKTIKIVEDVLYFYSWIIVGMFSFFIIRFLQGRAEFQSYNMGLSYALLLPMVTLYKNGGVLSYIGAIICFFSILVFGSRGALVAGAFYILYDIISKNIRNLIYIILASFFFVSLAIAFGNYLDSLGISSRTLNFIIGGEMIAAEGRDEIYQKAISLIGDNWLTGLGIYGDRVNMEGEYCHNIVLEILLDYGVLIGMLLVLVLFFTLIRLYFKLDSINKNIFVKYVVVLLIPFFASSSYLIDCNWGLLWGIVVLLYHESGRSRANLSRA